MFLIPQFSFLTLPFLTRTFFFLRLSFLHLKEVSYFAAASRLSSHYVSLLPSTSTHPSDSNTLH